VKIGGIKEAYPRIPLHIKLRSYIQLIRPFTLLAPIVAGFLLTIAPVEIITWQHVRDAIYVGVTLALLQAAGQAINQAVDADIDILAKPYRPIPRGYVDPDEALGLGLLLMLGGIGRAFTLNITFGIIASIIAFFSAFYSLRPLSPRRVNPILNVLWQAIPRGMLSVIAAMSIYGSLELGLKYGFAGLLWVMAFQPTKDIPDAEIDRLYGIKTIPNTYGIKGLRIWMTAVTLWYAAYILAIRSYTLLLTLPMAVAIILWFDRKVRLLENNLGWVLFYTGLALLFLLVFTELRFLI